MFHPEQPKTSNNTSQEDSFIQLISGKKVVIPSNDPLSKTPEDDYIIIRTAKAAAIQNMSVADLLVYYANILAIETKCERYTGPQWDALVEGLDTLRVCSEIFSANTNKLSKVIDYIYTLSSRYQTTFFTVLAIIFETSDWMLFERQAVKNEEFDISAVVWGLKIGPKGLALGRSKGKTELETLLAAEEAWVASNQGTAEYEAKKKALTRLAAEVMEWGKGATRLFAAR